MNYSVNSGPSPSGGLAWTQRGPRRAMGVGLNTHYMSSLSAFVPPALLLTAELYLDARGYGGAGNWLDLSGHGYQAVPGAGTNAPTFVTDPSHPYFLYSIDDYHEVADAVGLNCGAIDWTIAAAVLNTPSGAAFNWALAGKKVQGLSAGYRVQRASANAPNSNVTVYGGTVGFPAASTSPGNEGVRTVVTGTRQAGVVITAYTDAVNTLPVVDTSGNGTNAGVVFRIGASSNAAPGLFANIRCYGVAVWRRLLTVPEIASLNGPLGFGIL